MGRPTGGTKKCPQQLTSLEAACEKYSDKEHGYEEEIKFGPTN
jgi:hypothetical protein